MGQSPVAKTDFENEIDSWQGASLGIRLEFENEVPRVTEIYKHVVDESPFQKEDQIISLDDLRFPGSSADELAELLNRTTPDIRLDARIIRDESEIQLSIPVFRKEYVDIQAIFRRLHKNKIINQHLALTERESYWQGFTQRMAASVQASGSPREATEALNRIIDEIGVSHTAIIPASAGFSFVPKSKGSIGLILQRHVFNGRVGYFVVDKKPGSPSYESDLLLGDEILTVNSVDVGDSRRLDLSGHEDHHRLFAIEAGIGEQLAIEYLHSPFDEIQTISITSETDPGTVESVRASSKTFEFDNQRIGYLRFWNLMSLAVNSEFKIHANKTFEDCDAIVMDLRGRGGVVPAVLSLDRSVGRINKPVVAIVDGLTRSAKEMLAYLLKKHEHVLVVGTRTSGAVTGATIMKLPSGNSLMFPVVSADSLKRFVDDTIIEGVGVQPDEVVEYFIPYSAGTDRILNVALQRAAELSKNSNRVANIKR